MFRVKLLNKTADTEFSKMTHLYYERTKVVSVAPKQSNRFDQIQSDEVELKASLIHVFGYAKFWSDGIWDTASLLDYDHVDLANKQKINWKLFGAL